MAAVLAIIVDEGKWLTFSMAVAGLAVAVLCYLQRRSSLPAVQRIAAAMNLGSGLTVGVMAFGHLLAVVVKLGLGTLREGSLLAFLLIGVSLLIPSCAIVRHTGHLLASGTAGRERTVLLHGWLAGTLLALGLHNLPLAAPSLLTAAYRLHSRPLVGWAIVGLAAIVTIGLFAGSLVFLASGQSFEQFQGRQ